MRSFHPQKGRCRASCSLVAFICCMLLAGCSLFSPSSSPPATSAPPPGNQDGPVDILQASRGCGRPSAVTPGTSADQTFVVNPAEALDQHTRLYRVHIPSGYRDDRPTPLVLYFHGGGGTALGGDRSSGFTALAERAGFIVAYGQGLADTVTGTTFWADLGPIDYGIDDVHNVSLMLDDLQQKFCIDAYRVFASGFSSGGGMSNELACRLAGRIAAVAPVEGNFYTLPGGCHPARPISVLNIHGTADQALPYNGLPPDVNPSWPFPSIPEWLQLWAGRDGCGPDPTIFMRTPQVLGEQWTGCKGGATIMHYRIEKGPHAWPASIAGQATAQAIWGFFQAHPIP